MDNNNQRIAMKVSLYTILLNLVLSAFKLAAGILAGSAAMLSDAVHSFSDVVSTVAVMIGVKAAGKQADRNHPYGHERFECVAALILSIILGITGLGIGYSGVRAILAGNYGALAIPGRLALVAAIVSIAVKEVMYWYTRAAARRINSGALLADAWHHRSDALSSVGSFVGILGARIGFPILDPVASLVICVFIGKAAFDIFADALNKMTDHACSDDMVQELQTVILMQDNVFGIDLLRTRMFGNKIYVDVEIRADGNISLFDSHNIAHAVHDAIEERFQNVKHCMVHVNPQES